MTGRETRLQKIMSFIDNTGAPPMTKQHWKDLLEEVIGECESLLEAVTEEIEDERAEEDSDDM
jgi:hypothetical protein